MKLAPSRAASHFIAAEKKQLCTAFWPYDGLSAGATYLGDLVAKPFLSHPLADIAPGQFPS